MIAAGVLVVSMAASFVLVRKIEAVYPSAPMEDVLFISSPEFVKRASLGYSGLLADIYWMRVVQYFGRKHQRESKEYKALAPLLDIATTLDPNLVVAYEWGSTFLDQRLYFTLAFVQYLGQHDYLGAAKTFEEGSKVPGAHPWMKIMAAKMLTDAGNLETARYMWQNIYDESTDKNLKQNAELHLASLVVDQAVPQLESLISEFKARTGDNPTSWRDLIASGLLRSIPRDPTGTPYVFQSDGHVVVADWRKLPFITRGKPQ